MKEFAKATKNKKAPLTAAPDIHSVSGTVDMGHVSRNSPTIPPTPPTPLNRSYTLVDIAIAMV
jgi:hypothetical protein